MRRLAYLLSLSALAFSVFSCGGSDVPPVEPDNPEVQVPLMSDFASEFVKVQSTWEAGGEIPHSFRISLSDRSLGKSGMLDAAIEILMKLDGGASLASEMLPSNTCSYPGDPTKEETWFEAESVSYKTLLNICRQQRAQRISGGQFLGSVSVEGHDFCCDRLLVTLSRFFKFLLDRGIYNGIPARMASEQISCKFNEKPTVWSEHPKLFCNAREFAALAERVAVDRTVFSEFHNVIIGYAQDAISKEALPQYSTQTHILQIGSAPALRQLTALAYAFRVTGEKAYLTKAEEILNIVCAFPEWNAANAALAMGEMGLAVATAYDWLYDELRESTKELARTAMYKLVITPHLKAYGTGKYVSGHVNLDYLHFSGNWNQVCTCGAGVAAMVLSDYYPDECRQVIDQCVQSVKEYAAPLYGTQGNYSEGPSYWGYGTGMQCIFSMALTSYFGHDYGVGSIECWRRTPEYVLFIHDKSTGRQFDYCDSGEGMDNHPMFFFARRDNKPEYLYHEVIGVSGHSLAAAKYAGRFLPILFLAARDMDMGTIPEPEGSVYIGDGVQPIGVFRNGWDGKPTNSFLGVKGGTAHGNHAQMDVGSFVYDAGGQRWSSDPGNVTYSLYESAAAAIGSDVPTGSAQNSIRWWVNCYNNKHHSTLSIADDAGNPLFHGIGNNSYRASVTEITSLDGETGKGCIVNMTESRNLIDYLSSVTRSFLLKDDGTLIVVDNLTSKGKACNVQWRMLTQAFASTYTNSLNLSQRGKELKIQTTVTGADFQGYAVFPILHESYPWKGKNYENTWDTQYLTDYRMVGFTAHVPANTSATFKTVLKLK